VRFVVLLLFAACTPEPPETPPEPDPIREAGEGGDPVIVIARVLEVPQLPPCGDGQTLRVAIKYEKLRVEQGEFLNEEFLVRQDCPERDRDSGDAGPILAGAVHRLTLDPEPHRTARRIQWIPRRTDRAMP
jgi:hypothetical protein